MVTRFSTREYNFTGRFQYASVLLAFNEFLRLQVLCGGWPVVALTGILAKSNTFSSRVGQFDNGFIEFLNPRFHLAKSPESSQVLPTCSSHALLRRVCLRGSSCTRRIKHWVTRSEELCARAARREHREGWEC